MPVTETRRLILREMTPEDYGALYAVLGDSDIMEHYPYTFDANRVRGWIAKNIERYRVFGFGLWAVVCRESGDVIGDCGLTMQRIHGELRPEIGYHIRKDRQRKGYGGEAAAASRDWAFRNTPFRILYSYMKEANIASHRTALANGMRQVGAYADEEGGVTRVYAITRQEWQTMRREAAFSDPSAP